MIYLSVLIECFLLSKQELRRQCQQFAVALLHQSRSSQELAIILNHDPDSPPYEAGEHMKLARLELAINYKQKKVCDNRINKSYLSLTKQDAACCSPLLVFQYCTFLSLSHSILIYIFQFVAHPNIQQLLATIWYEGLPGFRRKPVTQKLMQISCVALLFPFYCMLYIIAPNTPTGKLMRKPFMKFLIHASSYLFFLCKYFYMICLLHTRIFNSQK
jgi:transient-receptor-potential-like protein